MLETDLGIAKTFLLTYGLVMPSIDKSLHTEESLKALVEEMRESLTDVWNLADRMKDHRPPVTEVIVGNDSSIRLAMRNVKAYAAAVKKGVHEARVARGDFGKRLPNGPTGHAADTNRRKSNANDSESAMKRARKAGKKST